MPGQVWSHPAAGTLHAGLKKLSAKLFSKSLIYTDPVSQRNTKDTLNVADSVFDQRRLDVEYIEQEFLAFAFGSIPKL